MVVDEDNAFAVILKTAIPSENVCRNSNNHLGTSISTTKFVLITFIY